MGGQFSNYQYMLVSRCREGSRAWPWGCSPRAVLVFACLIFVSVSPSLAQGRKASEYEIKAAYLYNFLLFVEWPKKEQKDLDGELGDKDSPSKEKSPADDDDEVVIGILGKDPFGSSFSKVEGKAIKPKGRKLVVKRFGDFRDDLDLEHCDLLFVCSSEVENVKRILKEVEGHPILTVSETDHFLEAGGMINLVLVDQKVRWEVNRTPAEAEKLRISSQLLRNAVRTVRIPDVSKKQPDEKKAEE